MSELVNGFKSPVHRTGSQQDNVTAGQCHSRTMSQQDNVNNELTINNYTANLTDLTYGGRGGV